MQEGTMTPPIELYQVDAFTSEPFRGNPAGVCRLDEDRPDDWMQAVAAEMNLSETAFLRRGDDLVAIRYFTPTVEVPLCGHATLASAHVLWEQGLVPADQEICFIAEGGRLCAACEKNWIRLDFPADPVRQAELPLGMAAAIGVTPRNVYRGGFPWYLLELESEQQVRDLTPEFTALRRGGFDSFIVTARSESPPADFVSRVFAPDVGIEEDPVTGVAHCTLGPFWSARLGKSELVGHQVSRRGGIVRVRPSGDRVHLLGQAVTVFRAEFLR